MVPFCWNFLSPYLILFQLIIISISFTSTLCYFDKDNSYLLLTIIGCLSPYFEADNHFWAHAPTDIGQICETFFLMIRTLLTLLDSLLNHIPNNSLITNIK